MEFKDKVIFIISYEEWGDMLMSKHHYAVELGKLGNKVYFINRPDRLRRLKRGEITILSTQFENVFSVSTRFIHPYFLKFKVRNFYNFLTGIHLKKIIKTIGKYPDIVWSFDAGNTYPIKLFTKSSAKIYMPVDGPFGVEEELLAAEGADIIISITKRILDRYESNPAPKLQINHGVSQVFVNEQLTETLNQPLRIGYAGSLVRDDLDMLIFKSIIEAHPDKVFEFWGENDPAKSTIHLPQDVTLETKSFLQFLKTTPNVIMHGAVKPHTLAEGLKRMDALLIAYRIKDDQNHHKVLEYLGTGKVIISSYMSSYIDYPDLIQMARSKDNNEDLLELFNYVMKNIQAFNTLPSQHQRLEFAKANTYPAQIGRIEKTLRHSLITV
jgi:glycosyltransferase involved in cell wall biosynthesis